MIVRPDYAHYMRVHIITHSWTVDNPLFSHKDSLSRFLRNSALENYKGLQILVTTRGLQLQAWFGHWNFIVIGHDTIIARGLV